MAKIKLKPFPNRVKLESPPRDSPKPKALVSIRSRPKKLNGPILTKAKYIVQIHHANFVIHVGKDGPKQPKRSFWVTEERLRVKSDIWYTQIQAARDRGEQYCWLKFDSPEALEIILNIIHGNSEANPKLPTLKTLFQVAQSSHRHGLVSSLREFVRAWSTIVSESPTLGTKNRFRAKTFERRIFIPWIFGLQTLFDEVMMETISHLSVDECGDLVLFPSSESIDLDFLPDGAAGR